MDILHPIEYSMKIGTSQAEPPAWWRWRTRWHPDHAIHGRMGAWDKMVHEMFIVVMSDDFH